MRWRVKSIVLPSSDASWQIRNGSAPIAVGVLVDPHEIPQPFHDLSPLSPAWRLTDASVPFGMSSPSWPLTVTRPGLVGCLELTMATSCNHQRPAIVLQHPNHFTNLHPVTLSNAQSSAPIRCRRTVTLSGARSA